MIRARVRGLRRRSEAGADDTPRSRLAGRALLGEAVAATAARPTRAALTALGTVLGVGAFVLMNGLSSTATAQVSSRFDILRATEVRLRDTQPDSDAPVFTLEADERLEALSGVNAAGHVWTSTAQGIQVTARPDLEGDDVANGLTVVAASPGYFEATGAHLSVGRFYDQGHEARGDQVTVLGRAAAQRLGVERVESEVAVFIDGDPYLVVGIVDSVKRDDELLLAAMLPVSTASERLPGDPDQVGSLVDVAPGAAQVVADQASLAVAPQDPRRVEALAPPDPASLREAVEGDLAAFLLALAGVALVTGMVAIANTTLVAVLERTPEIGLRRALGASRWHIASQFIAEAAVVGSVGGVVGTTIGVIGVVAVSIAREWTAVIHPAVPLVAPVLGALAGVIAGLYPAAKAAATEPAEALRSG